MGEVRGSIPSRVKVCTSFIGNVPTIAEMPLQ
jgi:hypothetical protein